MAFNPSMSDVNSSDDINLDMDLFYSIMQEEPPDPGNLPQALTTQDNSPFLATNCPMESPEQPLLKHLDIGSTLAGQDERVTQLSFDSSEPAQSDTSSESLDFCFGMHDHFLEDVGSFAFPPVEHRNQENLWLVNAEHKREVVVDESRSSNTFDDSKSNASCTSNISLAQQLINKELVDLTTDTDSECENEPIERYGLAGKRRIPVWLEPADRPSKACCVRGPLTEVSHSIKGHEVSNFPAYELLPKISISANAPVKLDPSGFKHSFLERSPCVSGIGLCGWDFKAKVEGAPAHLYATNGLQDCTTSGGITSNFSCNINALKDIHSKERMLSHELEGLSSLNKEEAFLDEGLMTVPLLRHQRIALAWMEKRERGSECSGGILADDQGLGKTVSTIALILKEKPCTRNLLSDGATQVSCEEMSTVDLEDDDCHPISTGHTGCSYRSEKETSGGFASGLKGRPSAGTLVVCPTSVLRQWAHELKEKVSVERALSVHLYHGSGRTKDPIELAKHDIVLTTYSIVTLEVPKQPLPEEKEADGRNPSHYCLSSLIGSEEQTIIKKKTTKVKKLVGESEKAGPLAKVAWFRVVLDEAQSIKNRRTQAARACWGLRAKRRWCLSGTPIQNTIDDLYSYFRFLKYEPYSVYKFFRSEIKEPIFKDPALGYRRLQLILRKVLLRRTKQSRIDGEPILILPEKVVALEQVEFTPEERAFYAALETQCREQFQMYAAEGTVQSNYVNILVMLLRLRQACDHPLLVKGGQSDVAERSNVECARRLSVEKRRILLSVLERNSDACSICSDAPEDAVVTVCSHVFCRQCLFDKLAQDDSASCPFPKCEALLSSSTVYSWSALKSLVDGIEDLEPSPGVLAQPGYSPHSEPSSKIKAVIKILRALPVYCDPNVSPDGSESLELSGFRTEKAIVFSQWTSMLDLLEASLKKEGFCFRRLDGTMSIQARDRALADFKQLPNVTVIIMSLKAASLGLNMVTASHVLLIDVWWNPTTEDQAVDRAHRIGQTRAVNVSRFTVKHTIEDRILELQERKRKLVASAFGENSPADQKTRLSMEEMRYLFRV